MKTKLFTFAIFLLCLTFSSTNAYAQTTPGGEDNGDGTITDPEGGGTVPSTYTYKSFIFKRNNGNGLGVCGINAQIRVVFDPMPTIDQIPDLTSVLYKSDELIGKYIAIDRSEIINQTQPYVSYCVRGLVEVAGAYDGNIPPAEKLTIAFKSR